MPTHVLEIKDLVKSYRAPDGSTSRVIDVPTFALEAGQQVALMGDSGSGKTTLLNLIAGIVRADAGRILLDGHDLSEMSEGERDRVRAMRIGYVFQTFNLLQGYTATQNVALGMMFGPGADYDAARDLLTTMGLGDRLHHRPSQLSVGQQQRVAVARALANKPKLVLADEPTGNLDAARARQAISLIRDMCREQGAALLCVSHDQALLAQFEDVRDLIEINRANAAVA